VSRRSAARLAWSLCGVSAALVLASLAFSILDRDVPNQGEFGVLFDTLLSLALLAFPVVGALVASREPRNSIGWLFCAVGVPFGLSGVAHGWAVYTLFANPGALPAGEEAAWLANWVFVPPLFAIPPLLFLLFPDGRPLTRRWRPVTWLVAVAVVATTVGSALEPGRLEEPPFKAIDNPMGVDGAGQVLEGVSGAGFIALFLAILLGAASLVRRFRHARGDERQQLKWFATAAALFALACVAALSPWMGSSDTVGQFLILLAFVAIPIAAGVAILKYRLYDVDLVINRTLVYGALTAILAGAYLGSVLVLQLALGPLTEDNDLAIAGSTLAVAALFRPARRRIQAAVDRRFYRRRYDAARTLERFGGRLRDEVDLDALGSELRAVVSESVQPVHVSLWLRSS
jgi:hypothetical protein